MVGFFFTFDTIASALLRPFGGWVSDSIGRLQAVGIGTVFGFLGMLGYAIAPGRPQPVGGGGLTWIKLRTQVEQLWPAGQEGD